MKEKTTGGIVLFFCAIALLFVFLGFGASTVFADASWYDGSWGYRVKITVQASQVDADLSAFPVYVSLADLPAGFHSHVKSDGSDIRVTASDGTTEVPREVVSYSSSTDTGEVHFKAASISSTTDTDFYIYYGNAAASDYAVTDTYGRNNTWAAYAAVWHLQDIPTGLADDVIDSTGNGNDLTSQNSMGAGDIVDGKLGGRAYQFTTDDWLNGGDILDMGTNDMTVSTWVKTTDNDFALFAKSFYSGTSNRYTGGIRENGAAGVFGLMHGSAQVVLANNTGTTTYDGNWHNYVIRFDRDNLMQQLIDASAGVSANISAQSAANVQASNIFIVGGYNNVAGTGHNDTALELNGTMDEVRVSYSARSNAWLSAEYKNQNSPATFYSLAAEESVTVPGAPTGLTPTASDTQVSLSWTTPVDTGGLAITDYVIDYKPTATSTWSTFADGVSTATSGVVTGLTNGTSYDFRVSAVNDAGQGSASDVATTTPATIPGAPTSVSAAASNAEATVSFTPPASDGGSAITGYTVTSDPGGFTGTGASSPITVTGLTNGTAYTFTVAATNAVGTGPESSPSNSVTPATVPSAPTAVSATAGNAQVSLSWSAPAFNGGSAITDYVIEYKLTATSTWSTFADGVGTATSSVATGLTNGSSYDFRVSAVNAAGQGSASSVVSSTPVTIPGAPTDAVAVRGNTQATISFNAPASDGGSAITNYTVASDPENHIGTGASSPITVTGLTNGTAYTFTVAATNAVGTGSESSPSNSVTPATTPDAPTSPSATAGNAQAEISFVPPLNDGGSAITGYTVTSDPGGFTGTGASSPITVTGLTNGTAYTFTVFATNDVGAGSVSTASNPVTPVTTPGTPIIGAATSSNAEATVSFTPPASDGGSAITGYTVTSDPGGFTGTGASSPITVTGLTNGTAYTFTVAATNAVGTGPESSPSNSVTPATVPDPPTALTPTAGNSRIALSWTAPADDGGSAVTDYVIEYKLTATSTWSTFADGVSTDTNGTVTGLANGTSYEFRVSAVNNVGQGGSSSSATAIPVTTPGTPIIGAATSSNAEATVSFTPPASDGGSAITGYTVTSDPGGFTGTGASSPITVTGLTNGTAYTFTVAATNAVGTGPESSPSNSVTPATVPDPPTAVSAAAGNAEATVSFTPPASDGGSAITGYTVTSDPGGFTGTGASSPITVTGLTNGTAYTFTVAATNAVGTGPESSPSNSVTLSTEPDAPVNLAATVQGSSIGLTWSAPASDGGSVITDYIVEYQLTTGGAWSVFADGTNTNTAATVTGLSNGTSYDFRVSAVNVIGQSVPSASVAAIPGEPAQVLIQSFTDLTAYSIGAAVRITNEGAGDYEYQYEWCVTDAADNLCGGGDDVFSASAAKLIQAGQDFDTIASSTVPAPGNYWFHVAVTYGSESSTAHQSFTAVATYPDAPTAVSATAGNAEATVSFTPPASDGGSAITGYTATSDPGGFTGTGASSPITVTGLTNGTAYTFTVFATNAVGAGVISSASNSVTPATVPDAPTGISATAGDGQISLSWSAPPSDGGSAIIDYVIEYKLTSDFAWSVFADGVSATTNVTVTNLTNNVSYDFRVSAVNAIGQSAVNSTSATASVGGVVSSGGDRGTIGYRPPPAPPGSTTTSVLQPAQTLIEENVPDSGSSRSGAPARTATSGLPQVTQVIPPNEITITPVASSTIEIVSDWKATVWILVVVLGGIGLGGLFAFLFMRRRRGSL